MDGNWDVTGFPNDALHGASITTGSDLTVNLGATPVTVAELTLEGTSAGTDILLSADSGGRLLFDNSDNNTFDGAGGVIDLAPYPTYLGVNDGRVYVTSNGVAGSTNEISAPIGLRNNGFLEGVDFFGNTSITLSGDIDIAGYVPPAGVEPDVDDAGQIRSYLPEGTKLLISGNVVLDDAVDPTYPRTLSLNNYFTTDPADPPRGTIEVSGAISGAGAVVIGSTWEYHTEQEGLGRAPAMDLPLSTVILSGDNSSWTGDVVLGRGNTVIRTDTALGTGGALRMAGEKGEKKEVGVKLVVEGGDRTIADNRMVITRWLTIEGDSSLTWGGIVNQDNSYGLINLLPHDTQADTGPSLTLSGPVYMNRRQENPPLPGRIITLDGTGKTAITGGLHDIYDDYDPGGEDPAESLDKIGQLRKRGTGSLVIDYDEANLTDSPTDYGGHTWMQGGNLHYATTDDLPNPQAAYDWGSGDEGDGQILSSNGAIGVDSGVVSNSTFLGMLNNSSNPYMVGISGVIFFNWNDQNAAVFDIYDDGGLMLGTSEYSQDLNFNSGDLANAANMSLAAHETGNTYTGTITPSTSVRINPNTYQLGGGSGTLTLPNVQLTGSNNLLVTNGGEVRLEGANTFSGTTKVNGKIRTSLQEDAAIGTGDSDGDGNYSEEQQQQVFGTTLTVTNLTDGGSASSIGSSSNSADNLMIEGSTLKYVGGTTSTDRLFTVGTAGATIDASGSGELVFSNSGALGIDTAEDRLGVMKQSVGNNSNNEVFGVPDFYHPTYGENLIFSTEDLVPGMGIRDIDDLNGNPSQLLDDDSLLEIIDIAGSDVIHVGETDLAPGEIPWQDPNPNLGQTYGGIQGTSTYIRRMTFGPAPARMLTLTGSNTGNNTLTPVVADASDRDEAWDVGGVSTPLGGAGGNGSVGIRKTGAGTWVLAGANTYTGVTSVEEGTLVVTGSTGTGDTTVAAGATLGGDGTVAGNLIADGIIAPGASPGALTVAGDYMQNTGATLMIDIAGTSAGSFDVLDVSGTADLAGLIDVVLDPGFTLGASDSFDILFADTLIDSGIALAPGGSNGQFTLSVNTTTGVVTLQASGGDTLIGDYNGDGMVDAADYTVWRDNVGGTTLSNRDPANTGLISEDDYTSWKAHFGESSSSGSLATVGAVPEPSALCLAVLAVLVVAAGRSRRR